MHMHIYTKNSVSGSTIVGMSVTMFVCELVDELLCRVHCPLLAANRSSAVAVKLLMQKLLLLLLLLLLFDMHYLMCVYRYFLLV